MSTSFNRKDLFQNETSSESLKVKSWPSDRKVSWKIFEYSTSNFWKSFFKLNVHHNFPKHFLVISLNCTIIRTRGQPSRRLTNIFICFSFFFFLLPQFITSRTQPSRRISENKFLENYKCSTWIRQRKGKDVVMLTVLCSSCVFERFSFHLLHRRVAGLCNTCTFCDRRISGCRT